MHPRPFASVLIALSLAGCGYQSIGSAPEQETRQVSLQAAGAVAMKTAFQTAMAYAAAELGDDFRPVMAFGDRAFDAKGNPQPTTWQFNLVGHLRGEKGYSYVKVKVGPEGQAHVDPKTGGPFPDRNGHHQLPQLDLLSNVSPENGMQIVMNTGYGKKFPPAHAVSFEVRPSDRLKQTVMTYRWASKKDGQKWWVDTSLNPITGKVVENNAAHE